MGEGALGRVRSEGMPHQQQRVEGRQGGQRLRAGVGPGRVESVGDPRGPVADEGAGDRGIRLAPGTGQAEELEEDREQRVRIRGRSGNAWNALINVPVLLLVIGPMWRPARAE